MSAPVPVADPVRAHVRRLEAERLKPAPDRHAAAFEDDLNALIACLARLLGDHDARPADERRRLSREWRR